MSQSSETRAESVRNGRRDRRGRALAIAALALIGALGGAADARADDRDEIKKLVPTASGMSLRDFDRVMESPVPPTPKDIESKTLTWMLFFTPASEDERMQAEYRYLNGLPRPAQIAREMTRYAIGEGKARRATGPVTLLQADRITDMTCAVAGDTAKGQISFEVPGLLAGRVDYIARKRDGRWRIEAFSMPARGLHIVLDDQGVWVESKPGASR